MRPGAVEDAPLGLRERRRLQTEAEIHEAAISLFEEKGVAATTVQDIADRAGISSRTFFRYFASKDQAALPGHRRMLDVIESLDVSAMPGPVDPMHLIADAAERVMLSENTASLGEHRRIARLLAMEGDMRSLAAAQEQDLSKALRAALQRNFPEHDDARLLLVAEVYLALWRTSWIRWGELAAEGEAVDPILIFRECRSQLDSLFQSGAA
ncbi:TetR family transcriptional regulator [Neomicrococcus lactis]|uniref:TetR family transcriptional regulator n=1 Tax=Neomicrococcus lactis TaxID=732241 RepID=UPI002300BF98|nr:TetR family transcriptional regulator [Neomicrococcus lactis]